MSCCPSRRGCVTHGPNPRDHSVICRTCPASTWNISAHCDDCMDRARFPVLDPSPDEARVPRVERPDSLPVAEVEPHEYPDLT